MRLWVGRYAEEPRDWFLVWAESFEEALRFTSITSRIPQESSMREMTQRGHLELDLVDEGEGPIFKPLDLFLEDEEVFHWVEDWERVDSPGAD